MRERARVRAALRHPYLRVPRRHAPRVFLVGSESRWSRAQCARFRTDNLGNDLGISGEMAGDVGRVAFGPFVLDGQSRELFRDGVPVHLTPKATDVLLLLVEKRPAVVFKQELLDRIWPDCFIAEATLASVVAELRKALRGQGLPRYVETVHGKGYRFWRYAHEIHESALSPPTRGWIVYAGNDHRLMDGEHILGRDHGAWIVLSKSTVSRRHAKIVVTERGATIEDLASRNGTFLNTRRIVSLQTLEDGDRIAIGGLTLTYQKRNGTTATATREGTDVPDPA